MNHADALAQLAQAAKHAGRQLLLERLFAAGAVLGLSVALWAAFAMSGLFDLMPLLLQSVSSLIALVLFVVLALRARRSFKAPSEAEARARLIEASRLEAGVFEPLSDQPVRYEGGRYALWRRALEKALARVEELKPDFVLPRLEKTDPYFLRYGAAALLLATAAHAGADAPDRLSRAFLPDPGPFFGDTDMAVEAWATPAAYTHAAPVSLSDRLGARIATPPSVSATVRLTGPAGAPSLVFEGRDTQGRGAHARARFTRTPDGAWQAQLDIPGPGKLSIVRFHTRGYWRIAPAADGAPRARFSAPIALMPQEGARIEWSASDDFGVSHAALRVRPINPPEGLKNAPPVDTPLETPAGDPIEAAGASEEQLGPHPYAGMEVEARIVAFDALGQAGESEPMRLVMPQKVFLQPLARAAIEARRALVTERRAYRPGQSQRSRQIPAGDILLGSQRIEERDPSYRPPLNRAPEGVRRAERLIDSLTMEPQDGYFRDLAVFLGLKLARAEINNANSIEETDAAVETLWLTALRAEYGGSSDARRALEEARRQLAEALRQGAPQERINELMQAMREATQRYLQALVQEAVREGRRDNVEDTEEQTQLSARDLQQALEDVERLSKQGRNEEAQRLLDQLTQILQNLSVNLQNAQNGEGGEDGGSGDQQMQQSLDQLAEAMGQQRALNDDTQDQVFRRDENGDWTARDEDGKRRIQDEDGENRRPSEQGGGGQGPRGGASGGGDELAQRQADIREQVGKAQQDADGAGAAPSESLNRAQQAMRTAENALARGDVEGARAAQDAALDAMREGSDALAVEMRDRMNAASQSPSGSQQGGPRDPLGRQIQGNGPGEGTEVPSEISPARAREIMDEIRRRAQDQSRPEAEREYLRRLLDRFNGS